MSELKVFPAECQVKLTIPAGRNVSLKDHHLKIQGEQLMV